MRWSRGTTHLVFVDVVNGVEAVLGRGIYRERKPGDHMENHRVKGMIKLLGNAFESGMFGWRRGGKKNHVAKRDDPALLFGLRGSVARFGLGNGRIHTQSRHDARRLRQHPGDVEFQAEMQEESHEVEQTPGQRSLI